MEEIKRIVECPICTEAYFEPRVLPCFHTFCRRCFEVYTRDKRAGDSVTCPLCRATFDLPAPCSAGARVRNLFVEKLLRIEKAAKGWKPQHSGSTSAPDTLLSSWLAAAPSRLEAERANFRKTLSSIESSIQQRDNELKSFIDSQTRALLRELAEEGERRESEFDVVAVELKKATISEWESPSRSENSPLNSRKDSVEFDAKQSKSNKSLSQKLKIFSKSEKGQRKSEKPTGNLAAMESPVSNGNLASILDEPFLNIRVVFSPPEGARDLLGSREVEGSVVGKISVVEKSLGPSSAESSSLMSPWQHYPPADYLPLPTLLGWVHVNPGPVVTGVVAVDNSVYLLRSLTRHVEEYDSTTFMPRGVHPVPGLANPQDMAGCLRQRCLYASDSYDNSVWRIPINDWTHPSKWTLGDDEPSGVAVTHGNSTDTVVTVTCMYAQKVYQFAAALGAPLRCVYLQPDLAHPRHAVPGGSGVLVVCHGYWSTDPLHRVCLARVSDGRSVEAFGDAPGAGLDSVNQPMYLVVDERRRILVADNGNDRVGVLNPALGFVRELVGAGDPGGMKAPHRMCLDEGRGRLYVVENMLNGRVLVYGVRAVGKGGC